MMGPAHRGNESQAREQERVESGRETSSQEEGIPDVRAPALPPIHQRGAAGLNHSAVLKMQRHLGNAFVQRQLAGSTEADQRGSAAIQRAPEDEQAGPTSIGDGSAQVSATGGSVKAQGATIDLDAAMIKGSGVLEVDTLVADSVVASNYTPGAGNVY